MSGLKTRSETREIGQLDVRAMFQPETLNEAERTIELVWTTGAKVRRSPWFGDDYFEELSLDPDAVKMERLQNGAPVLDSHWQYELRNVIGVVEKAWLTGTEGRAVVRFADSKDVEDTWQKVKTGIVRNVSVGYIVHRYQDVSASDDKLKTWRAIEWEPVEISMVPVPADAKSGTRNQDLKRHKCEFITTREVSENKGESMPNENQNVTAATPDVEQVRREAADQARTEERQRVASITETVRSVGLTQEFANELINAGVSEADANKRILGRLREQQESEGDTRSANPHVTIQRDEFDTRREAMQSALLHRANPVFNKLSEAGREFRGMTLLEMAKDTLHARGISTKGMTKMQIARAAMSSSDFKAVFENVVNKQLRKGYEAAPQTWRSLASFTTAPDFKPMSRPYIAGSTKLEKVAEGGEFKYGTLGDGKEVYALGTYGKIIGVTRQMIVNDDIGALNITEQFGQGAADLESDLCWDQIGSNPKMGDNKTLFHADHNNVTDPGTAIAIASMGVMRKRARLQKEGKTLLNIMLDTIIVPAALETVAEQYVAANVPVVAAQADQVNGFRGRLEMIVEGRLDGYSEIEWYMAAAKGRAPILEVAYLAGEEGLVLEDFEKPEVDGICFKARLDFAAKVMDYRGIQKNKGA